MSLRHRITVQGVVQGIGFRPFVYRLAFEESLLGFVRNDAEGVIIEVEGTAAALERFAVRLAAEIPTGGRIDGMKIEPCAALCTESQFRIMESQKTAQTFPSVAPDRFVCADCLQEMRDPSDRRYKYPFINCTHCGPRYTIIHSLPYDRPNTTMRAFPLCAACQQEYTDPTNRRFHAEPIACPICGPHVWIEPSSRMEFNAGEDPIHSAAAMLADGRIVAVKGIGGFHLAANAFDRDAVMRLRAMKRRPRKPFAMMVKDIAVAKQLAEFNEETARLLTSPPAPIVLVPAAQGLAMTAWIAPGLKDLGILLPYSPLHHLLLEKGPAALVMTSGNAPSEPISIQNDDALQCLGADATLLHNRDITTAADDSVFRMASHGPVMIRRARGYVPSPMPAAHLPSASVLGLGALLKVTVSVLHQGQLVVGRHLGDLDNERAEDAFAEEVDRMMNFLRFTPESITMDLYPDSAAAYLVRDRFPTLPIFRVQHHHAHMAAVMTEYGLSPYERVVGIVLDGFGLGPDGALWGGEVLVGGYAAFERAAHLRYVPQPGGDKGAEEPGRMALSLLLDAKLPIPDGFDVDPHLREIVHIPAVSPMTSSAGRLFDGAAALLGIAPTRQDFEGEAAALLEAVADPSIRDAYPLPLTGDILDTRDLICSLAVDPSALSIRAARFINGLADGLICAAARSNSDRAVLAGGCMVNRLLAGRLMDGLSKLGIEVLFPRKLPPGDGAISAGQVAVAACGDPRNFK